MRIQNEQLSELALLFRPVLNANDTMVLRRLFSNEHPTTLGVKGSSETKRFARCAYKNCCVEIELLHGGFSGSCVLRVERYAINGQIETRTHTKQLNHKKVALLWFIRALI